MTSIATTPETNHRSVSQSVRDVLNDCLKHQLTQWLLPSIIGAGALWFASELLPVLQTETGSKVAAALIGLSSTLALVATWNWRKTLASQRLWSRFGFYWNDQLEPHCPSCQSLLHSYAQYDFQKPNSQAMGGSFGFRCSKCNAVIHLHMEDLERPTIKKVRETLREMREKK